MADERLRPHRRWSSVNEEIMQINLARGEWVQVCVNVGTVPEPRYEIVQVMHTLDGKCDLRADVPALPWKEEVTDNDRP